MCVALTTCFGESRRCVLLKLRIRSVHTPLPLTCYCTTLYRLANAQIATMDLPYEGIPTVPPRKDMDHFAFFCSGKRYLVAGQPSESVTMLKQRAFDGGLCATSNPETEVHKWEDIVFIYAGQVCVFCCFDDGRSGNVGLGRFG